MSNLISIFPSGLILMVIVDIELDIESFGDEVGLTNLAPSFWLKSGVYVSYCFV